MRRLFAGYEAIVNSYIDAQLLHQLLHNEARFADLDQAQLVASLMANELLRAREDRNHARAALSDAISANRRLKDHFDQSVLNLEKKYSVAQKQRALGKKADELLSRPKKHCKHCNHLLTRHRDPIKGCSQCGCDIYKLEAKKLEWLCDK